MLSEEPWGQETENGQRTFIIPLWLVLLGLSLAILMAGVLGGGPFGPVFWELTKFCWRDPNSISHTLAFFAPVIAFKILFGFSGRLVGKPQLYLAGTITTISANIILDYVTVGLMGLGVRGAAFATGLAYLAGLLVVAGPMFRKETVLNVYDGRFRSGEILYAAFNGSSEGVTYAAAALTVFLMNRVPLWPMRGKAEWPPLPLSIMWEIS